MAGIGFSLRRLFDQKGVFNLCKAYGYAGIITAGPMLLGIALLAGVSAAARAAGLPTAERELLSGLLTYSLLAALAVTSWFNMGVTRYVSDMLYSGKNERVMPALYGSSAMMLVLCTLGYGGFLLTSGLSPVRIALCLWFSLILVVVWTEMIFMSALKDYQAIIVVFSLSMLFGFALMAGLVLLKAASLEVFLLTVIAAYGLMMWRYLVLLLRYFPEQKGSSFAFLRWMSRYKELVIAGGLLNAGLFGHMIVMYLGPLRVRLMGHIYGAPQYDIPAMFAFFCLLITTISFVTSVEVRFYPKYRDYYGLFNDRGTIGDIHRAEKEMLEALRQELVYVAIKQVFTCVLFVVLGARLLDRLPLGFSDLSLGVFRFLCIGYGTYALANTTMLILLYFEDYRDAMIGAALFALVSTGGTLWQILRGDPHFYGVGFFAGALVFFVWSVIALDVYVRKLPYHLLSRQSLIPKEENGLLVRLGKRLSALSRQEEEEADGR